MASPPVAPFTCHVTAVLVEPVTVAVNCCVAPPATLAVVGEMVIATPVVVELLLPPHPDHTSTVAVTRNKNGFMDDRIRAIFIPIAEPAPHGVQERDRRPMISSLLA